MASTFGSMEISKTGMMTYNAAIQTTAHNIANIETKGYSRQKANYEALVANKSSATVQGFGVGVVDVTRERNEYYDNKYIRTQASYSKYDTDTYYLGCLQDLICGNVTSDDKSRIMDAFDDFYSSLSNLVGNPLNQTIRTEAITRAQTMAEYIQNMGTNMQQLQDEANTEIKSCVDQINAIADKIVSLNRQINVVEAYGTKANDLRDQRSLLIDELSQYANVETVEKEGTIEKKSGRQVEELTVDTQYYVYINGNTLVDGYKVNRIVYTQKESYSNICDMKGLYELEWADGTDFLDHSRSLGGKLQALFEMRDGNNSTSFEGKIADTAYDAATKTSTLTFKKNMSAEELADFAKMTDKEKEEYRLKELDTLNIPTHDGEIYINGKRYVYDTFEAQWDPDNMEYTYVYTMKKDIGDITQIDLVNIAKTSGMTITVGEDVQSRGIPYYFAQLNEFVRTFSRKFNEIQNAGDDLYDESGIDFFTAKTPTQGVDYVMNETNHSFNTADMNETGDATYYYMSTANYKVAKEMLADPKKLACKTVIYDADGHKVSVGNDNWENIQKLSELKDDSSMFLHGAPDSFIQSLASSMGVECARAESLSKSQHNLLLSIDRNRQSISGVDEDEEAEDLMVFQQMLMNQYKVLSVMNQVLDKLINGTAV